MRNYRKQLFELFIFIFLVTISSCFQFETSKSNEKKNEGLNRFPTKIFYSNHAKCRMECRQIDEDEVKAIINHGVINMKKSDLSQDQCHDRYALEGFEGGQHMRIIVASCNDNITVITCIDLEKEWPCDCN